MKSNKLTALAVITIFLSNLLTFAMTENSIKDACIDGELEIKGQVYECNLEGLEALNAP